MYPHWAYVIGDLFGDIQGVFTRATTGTKRRVDENGRVYDCDADDTAMSIFELANGQLVQWFSSWAVRVHRRDLWAIQVDGTRGSATAGMTQCHVQSEPQTPRPIWNPDAEPTIDYLAGYNLNRAAGVNCIAIYSATGVIRANGEFAKIALRNGLLVVGHCPNGDPVAVDCLLYTSPSPRD